MSLRFLFLSGLFFPDSVQYIAEHEHKLHMIEKGFLLCCEETKLVIQIQGRKCQHQD